METLDVLKKLGTQSAVTGYEKDMSESIAALMKPFCDGVEIDRFYNVIGFSKGCGSGKVKAMVTAHYDEIGLVVKSVDEKGFLRVSNMGGIDPKVLLAQEVIVHGKTDIPGVIGARPPHVLKPEDAKIAIKLEDIAVDTGMADGRLKEIVSIGDVISFNTPVQQLQGNKVSMKAADNRSGVAALIEAAKHLQQVKHELDVYFVATSQEEFELSGATTAAYNLRPDLAVVIDVGHGDMSGVSREDTLSMGKGPSVCIGPTFHRALALKLLDISKEEYIPSQREAEPRGSGTEAWAIQVSRHGIPTALLSIPLRYMHTPVEVIDLGDVKAAARLAAGLLSKSENEMGEILCF